MPKRRIVGWLRCVLCAAVVTVAVGCAKGEAPVSSGAAPPADVRAPGAAADSTTPSLEAQHAQRKVIRNAELDVTVASPSTAQREAAAIAERFGGYLVSTERTGISSEDGPEPGNVRVVLRVSADKFDAALDALKRLGQHVGVEQVSSKDVTEEYVDLEARIKTQKKLEEQYLEILKGATKVEDALAVHKQLAEVRGEIEKHEGRKRLLDSQLALSTFTVTFREARPLISVSSSAFGRAVRRAGGDVVNVGAGIVIGAIRLAGVMLPIGLLVLLPLYFVLRLLLRRVLRPVTTAAAG